MTTKKQTKRKQKPQLDFLRGDFGKAMLEEYHRRVRDEYNNRYGALKDLALGETGVVLGNSVFSAVLMNQIIKPHGFRVAKPSDLVTNLRTGYLDLKGNSIDAALHVIDPDNLENYLNQALVKEIKTRYGTDFQFPVAIPLSDLELSLDSDNDLLFGLSEDPEIISLSKQVDDPKASKKFSEKNIEFQRFSSYFGAICFCPSNHPHKKKYTMEYDWIFYHDIFDDGDSVWNRNSIKLTDSSRSIRRYELKPFSSRRIVIARDVA